MTENTGNVFSSDAHRPPEDAESSAGEHPRGPEPTADDRTGPPTADRYLEQTQTDLTASRSRTSSTVSAFAESAYTPGELLGDAEAPSRRFELLNQLGKGGSGRVYAMRDNSLKRVIAVKFLQRQDKESVRAHFVHEAQVTAMLEHPNIMPVYDLGVTAKHQLYYTMKKVEGITLGEAIRRAQQGQEVPSEFATIDGRVRILLKVCDAVAFAHHRGFIHRDIKPDNVMLGEYGEVLVLDWGSAVEKGVAAGPGQKHLCGTPAYMSPEQARREAVDERSDVYCLGATMFHVLTLRHPTWADDPETFWEKKRTGVIDPLSSEERRRIPAPLLKIALKALEPDPAKRYQSVTALADDLKRYQAGLAVSAHRENPLEAFGRWYRRNRRVFWLAVACVVGVGGVGTLLLREKIQELLTWRPFASERFSYQATSELAKHWRGYASANWVDVVPEPFSDSGGWRVENGGLHGYNISGLHNITYAHAIPGDIRVEWSVTPLLKNTNLNCYIGGETRADAYTFHVAGFGYADMVTLTRQTSPQVLERRSFGRPLEVGKTYRLRMEREGNHVRFYLNGRKVIDFKDYDILSGAGRQTFGFENNSGNRIRIDNVEVYYHPLPLRVSPLMAAERLQGLGHYRDALAQYREIREQYSGHDIAITALYKTALCLEKLDSIGRAIETLEEFDRLYPRHELAPQAGFDRYRILTEISDTAQAEAFLRDLGRRFPGHRVLATALNDMASRASRRLRTLRDQWVGDRVGDPTIGATVLSDARRVRDWATVLGIPAGDIDYLNEAAAELYNQEIVGFEELCREFPAQRTTQANALLDIGAYQRVLAEYSDNREACAQALNALGKYRFTVRRYPDVRWECAKALLALGRLEEVLKRFPDQPQECANALWRLGRFEELMTRYLLFSDNVALWLGRYEEYLAAVRTFPVKYASALLNYRLPDSAQKVLDATEPRGDIQYYITYCQVLMERGRQRELLVRFGPTQPLIAIFTDAYCQMGLPDSALRLYPQNQSARAMAFMELGLFDSVLTCPREEVLCQRALWLSGRHDEVPERYGHGPLFRAAVLLHEGRYKDVLESCPEIRQACARALYGLRRYPSILRYYPDQREACCAALRAMGTPPREILARYPEWREGYAESLVEEGRAQSVVDSFSDQQWPLAMALLMLGREDEIERGTVRLNAQETVDFAAMRAIHYAAAGDFRRALALLRRPRYWSRTWHDRRFPHLLLEPILMGLAGDTAGMRRQCRAIMEGNARTTGQQLWYEAGWLAGVVSDEQFLAQPCRYFVRERLILLKAIRADVARQRDEAWRLYRVVRETPHCRHPWLRQLDGVTGDLRTLFHNRAVRRFIEWRVAALTQ